METTTYLKTTTQSHPASTPSSGTDDPLGSFKVRTVARGISGLLSVTASDGRKATAFQIEDQILLSDINGQPPARASAERSRIEGEIRAALAR